MLLSRTKTCNGFVPFLDCGSGRSMSIGRPQAPIEAGGRETESPPVVVQSLIEIAARAAPSIRARTSRKVAVRCSGASEEALLFVWMERNRVSAMGEQSQSRIDRKSVV